MPFSLVSMSLLFESIMTDVLIWLCFELKINVMWLDLVTYLHHHGHEDKLPWYRGKVSLYSPTWILCSSLVCSIKFVPSDQYCIVNSDPVGEIWLYWLLCFLDCWLSIQSNLVRWIGIVPWSNGRDMIVLVGRLLFFLVSWHVYVIKSWPLD
jgi:hypothetical protein